ncbi:MAG: hypothetical protein U1A78_41950 [Polyangia bacterium]
MLQRLDRCGLKPSRTSACSASPLSNPAIPRSLRIVLDGSWGIDAAEGFAALAWLGSAAEWSITSHLASFERGVLSVGDSAWLIAANAGALGLAFMGLRFDGSLRRRALAVGGVLLTTIVAMRLGGQVPRSFDLTELRRASLPPAAAHALAMLPLPLSITVKLDRDDARFGQLELDVLSKLRIARPDVRVRFPLDERATATEAAREEDYVLLGSLEARLRLHLHRLNASAAHRSLTPRG